MTEEKSTKHVCHITTVHDVADVRILHRELATLADAGFETSIIARNQAGALRRRTRNQFAQPTVHVTSPSYTDSKDHPAVTLPHINVAQ